MRDLSPLAGFIIAHKVLQTRGQRRHARTRQWQEGFEVLFALLFGEAAGDMADAVGWTEHDIRSLK